MRVFTVHTGRMETQMKRKRHTPEQIIRMLRESEGKVQAGVPIEQVAKELGVSEATYHRWRKRYGGMKGPEMKRLKELERENGRLKKMVAERDLDLEILKEVVEGKY